MLGRYIRSYFTGHSKLTLECVDFRVNETSLPTLREVLSRHGAGPRTCVINCIGAIPQRVGIADRNYYVVNTLFPHYLWEACAAAGARLIQPTTDCVYSGARGLYAESDLHDEKNAYGLSKSLGEPQGATILRTSIIGEELVNKKSLLEWVRSCSDAGTMNGWVNHHWNGLTCLQVCKVIEIIIAENLYWSGVRHIFSPTAKSKYDLTVMINEIYELPTLVLPVETPRVDKTLISNFEICTALKIPELYVQIKEQKEFRLLE